MTQLLLNIIAPDQKGVLVLAQSVTVRVLLSDMSKQEVVPIIGALQNQGF